MDNVSLICFNFDKFINNNFFLTGQAHSAYKGKYMGGYAAGLFGAGIQSKSIFNNKMKTNFELLIGAGGGGSLALEEGAIVQSMFGITYNINDYIGILISAGKISALKSDLNNTAFNLGMALNFSTLNRIMM